MSAFFFDLVYVLPLTVISVLAGSSFLLNPENMKLSGIVGTCLSLLLTIIRHVKKKYRIIPIGIPAIVLLGIFLVLKPSERYAFLINYRWLLISIGLAVGAYVISHLVMRYIRVRLVMAFLLLSGSVLAMVFSKNIGKPTFPLCLFTILIIVADEIQRHWVKSGDTERKSHVVFAAPFILTVCFLAYVLPSKEQPVSWEFVIETWRRIEAGFERMTDNMIPGHDSYSAIGFSDQAKFSGSLGNNNKYIMDVTTSKNAPAVTYLVGRYLSDFDGKEWTADATEGRYRMFDVIETWNAVKKADPDFVFDYLGETSFNIKYRFFNSHYMFTPSKAFVPYEAISDIAYTEYSDSVKSAEKLGYNSEYTLSMQKVNRRTNLFRDLVSYAEPLTKDEWQIGLQHFVSVGRSDFSFDNYQNYRRYVHETYGDAPIISGEVQSKLDSLYEGAGTDIEKMERLEAWLSGMVYTTEPGPVPSEVTDASTFLDWFLLKKQEGYCSHFATTFVLLARAEGLPARYVQGYSLNTSSMMTHFVSALYAHGWAEVYFDNVGWVTFEPTPGKSIGAGWPLAQREPADRHKENAYDIPEDFSDISIHEEELTGEEVHLEEEEPFNILIILIPLGAVLLFLVTSIIVIRIAADRKFERLDETGKIKYLCRENMKLLSVMGTPVLEGETLSEYSKRISGEYTGEMLGFIPLYEEVLYSRYTPDKRNKRLCELSNRDLWKLVKKKHFLYSLFMG